MVIDVVAVVVRRWRSAWLGAALGVALTSSAAIARGQTPQAAEPPPSAPSAPPQPEPDAEKQRALNEAKELFRQGVTLFGAGDVERALDLFVRSRAAYPSAKNTMNVAICLDRLGRYDEALEMYEEVLLKYAAELRDADRAAITPAMATLRQKVGSLDLSSNVVGASVVIDGRARGTLPLTTPIRVLSGKRMIRVSRAGYVTFEKVVQAKAGETLRLDAKLEPLAAAGLLRVEDPELVGSEVFVDRVNVGTTPWEGTLGPGKHVVWTRKGEAGSAPTSVIVVQGQAALVRMRSGPLGPMTRVQVEPPSAHLSIDGVDLGAGTWEGRLPTGSHAIVVNEEGYRRSAQTISVGGKDAEPSAIQVKLAVDPDHPRWPKASRGEIGVAIFGGYAFGATLGAEAEGDCPEACSEDPSADGWLAGARAGYRVPFGLALELGGGFMRLTSTFARTVAMTWGGGQYPGSAHLEDRLSVQGPFVVGGASYRIGERVGLVPRFGVGVLFASARDAVTGTATGGGETRPAFVENAGTSVRATAIFLAPELGGDVRFGRLRVGAAFSARFFLADGPALPHGAIVPEAAVDCISDPSLAATIGCAQASAAVTGERAYGSFVVFSPELSVGYTF
jgi:hypothetical protein